MNLNKIKPIKKINQQIKQEVHNIYIIITSNNVLFTVTNLQGKTLLTYSSGAAQYKNHQKKNSTAINMTAFQLGQNILLKEITDINIIFKGLKKGRKDALMGLYNSGLKILGLKDLTPIPHNGCRRQKQRRI
jgi:small subunit ribosomal protein S11